MKECVSENSLAFAGIDPAYLPMPHRAVCRDPRLAPGEKPLALATLWRLMNKGKRRPDGKVVKLGTVITGRGRCATPATIAKFFADLNEPVSTTGTSPLPSPILPSHAEAELQLDALGVK